MYVKSILIYKKESKFLVIYVMAQLKAVRMVASLVIVKPQMMQ